MNYFPFELRFIIREQGLVSHLLKPRLKSITYSATADDDMVEQVRFGSAFAGFGSDGKESLAFGNGVANLLDGEYFRVELDHFRQSESPGKLA
jgi:hypothetical protein